MPKTSTLSTLGTPCTLDTLFPTSRIKVQAVNYLEYLINSRLTRALQPANMNCGPDVPCLSLAGGLA